MKKWILALALLFSFSAQAGYETGAADQVLVVPHAGGRPKYGQLDLSQAAAVKNQLPVTKGGTGQDLSAATGMMKVTAGSVSALTAAQARAFTNVAPTIRTFTSTGTTAGYLFTISTSSTVAIGDTYTNNANTYTVLAALTAQTGQVLFTSGASAPTSTGTLTRATGAGTSSITFTVNTPLAAYTAPTSPAPLFAKIKMVGAGGGGSGSGTTGAGNGGAGTATFFGAGLLSATGGGGGVYQGTGGGGGTSSLGTGPSGTAVSGGSGGRGGAGDASGSVIIIPAGAGANSFFGGAAGASSAANAGQAAATNTGSGGAGGGAVNVSGVNYGGSGGGAGGFVDAIISNLAPTYYYAVGTGGSAGTAGTNGQAGGAGAAGYIEVTEYYQ